MDDGPQRKSKASIREIRDYCEVDVLNTWLVYLGFERMRGNLHATQHDEELARLRQYLLEQDKRHFHEFLAAWPPEA